MKSMKRETTKVAMLKTRDQNKKGEEILVKREIERIKRTDICSTK
jgi:hypothetical protein